MIRTYLRDTVYLQTTPVDGANNPGTTVETSIACRIETAFVRKEAIQGNSLVGNCQLLIHPEHKDALTVGAKVRVDATHVLSVNMIQAAKDWRDRYFRVWLS